MIEFLASHYREIIVIAICLVEIIFFFLKKRPQLNLDDRILADLDDVLPGYIKVAELSGEKGSEKMVLVIKLCIERVKKFVAEIDEVYWAKIIQDKVEAILSTPQKKEIVYEKK